MTFWLMLWPGVSPPPCCHRLHGLLLCVRFLIGQGPSSAEGFEELLDLIGEGIEAGGADGVRTGRVSAEALAGSGIGER